MKWSKHSRSRQPPLKVRKKFHHTSIGWLASGRLKQSNAEWQLHTPSLSHSMEALWQTWELIDTKENWRWFGTAGVCRSTHVRAVVLCSDIQYGDVSFTNKGPRAGKNPIRLFPCDPTWFRISCHVTHYSNVSTLHSFNYVGNNFHQRRS